MWLSHKKVVFYLKQFEDTEDTLKKIKLENIINAFPQKEIFINMENHQILIHKKIYKEIIDLTEEEIIEGELKCYQKEEIIKIPQNKKIKLELLKEEELCFLNDKERSKENIKLVKKIKSYEKRQKIIKYLIEIKKELETGKKIFCFDFESFEHNQKKLLELGYSIYENGKFIKNQHYIFKENISIMNGKRVPNKKYNYNFGNSKIVPIEEAVLDLLEHFKNEEIMIIGQSINNDFNYLNNYIVSKENRNIKKTQILQKDLLVKDTFDMSFLIKENGMGIERMLEHFKIPYSNLHNGGNDTKYNIDIFNKIIETTCEIKLNEELNNLKGELEKLLKNYNSSNIFEKYVLNKYKQI